MAKQSGISYIAVAENDCGRPAYIDIYKITVDEKLTVSAEKVKHIDCYDGEAEITGQDLEKYPFIEFLIGEDDKSNNV